MSTILTVWCLRLANFFCKRNHKHLLFVKFGESSSWEGQLKFFKRIHEEAEIEIMQAEMEILLRGGTIKREDEVARA